MPTILTARERGLEEQMRMLQNIFRDVISGTPRWLHGDEIVICFQGALDAELRQEDRTSALNEVIEWGHKLFLAK